MGAFASRRTSGVEEVDLTTNNAYRYPPQSGCYFGSHFIMGGERFEVTQPESYLFGENQDLNFLGSRPVPFPYPAPQAHEPTKTLKSLVNIRKDSLRFVRVVPEDSPAVAGGDNELTAVHIADNGTWGQADNGDDDTAVDNVEKMLYNIEFTFDTDVKCAITIYYFATEEMTSTHVTYHPRDASMNSETFHYKRGANQVFSQTTHIVNPSLYADDDWKYNTDNDFLPIVIQCVVEEEGEQMMHSHMTFVTVERLTSEVGAGDAPGSGGGVGYTLKPLKQKQMVDGVCYLLQEIYGIENKNAEVQQRAKLEDDEVEDSGCECVICMCEARDTLILPCRHLCLCQCCADNLRYQASNCPICRAPFRALLQIRAMRKRPPVASNQSVVTTPQSSVLDENILNQEGVPLGYEAISLIDALNGTFPAPSNVSQVPPDVQRGLPADSMPTSPDESPAPQAKHKAKRRSHRARRQEAAIVIEKATEQPSHDDDYDKRGEPTAIDIATGGDNDDVTVDNKDLDVGSTGTGATMVVRCSHENVSLSSSMLMVNETEPVPVNNDPLTDKTADDKPDPLPVTLSDMDDNEDVTPSPDDRTGACRIYVENASPRPGHDLEDTNTAMTSRLLDGSGAGGTLSQPGTSATSTDDSGDSCSSTRSNRQLLFRQQRTNDDDDNDVTIA